jgi:hypothetical protein
MLVIGFFLIGTKIEIIPAIVERKDFIFLAEDMVLLLK